LDPKPEPELFESRIRNSLKSRIRIRNKKFWIPNTARNDTTVLHRYSACDGAGPGPVAGRGDPRAGGEGSHHLQGEGGHIKALPSTQKTSSILGFMPTIACAKLKLLRMTEVYYCYFC
jgi:hypothetical protein